MNTKYYDVSACMQVIGDVFMNPSLLDQEEKYTFHEEDFVQEFHKILFGSIYNLHQLGAKQISIEDIEKYLEQRPKKYSIYKTNKGSEYLENLKEMCQLAAFDYYYNLYQAQIINKEKDLSNFTKQKEKVFNIESPRVYVRPPHMWLEEEDE